MCLYDNHNYFMRHKRIYGIIHFSIKHVRWAYYRPYNQASFDGCDYNPNSQNFVQIQLHSKNL
jgi:hypothetical protein